MTAEQLMETILGSELNLTVVAQWIGAVVTTISPFVIYYKNASIRKANEIITGKTAEIMAQNKEIADIKTMLSAVAESQALTTLASKSLDPTIKAKIAATLQPVTKAGKLSSITIEAIQTAIKTDQVVISEENKQAILEKSEKVQSAIDEIVEKSASIVDKLL